MRITASVRFTLGDRPKNYHGVINESYTLGEHGSLASMVVGFFGVASKLYCIFCDADELNKELDKLRVALDGIKFEPEEFGVDADQANV